MRTRFSQLCLLVVCCAHGAAVAQDRNDQQAEHSVSVLCVDAEGKPVEGAEAYLFQNHCAGDNVCYLSSGPVKSDAAGRVSFPRAIFSDALGNFDRWIYARVPRLFEQRSARAG